jgi:hypothetical protein
LVSLLVDDYHYVDITVEIESTGGAVVSLPTAGRCCVRD